MDESPTKRSDIQCLIYQARTARNHYEIEDCLDLIDEMREVLERMMKRQMDTIEDGKEGSGQ